MQKITTALLLAAGVCLNAASARTIENDYKPYLGVNYAYGEVRAEGAHAYHNSGSFNLGSVYNKYFGTELFYQYSDKHKFDAGSDLKNTAFQAYGLDLMAYLPLGCEGRLAPTATMGFGEYSFKHDFRFSKDRRDRGWGYRFGGGLTYHIDENWSARLLARYVKIDRVDGIDHMNEYSFGVRYTFR